MRPKQPKLSLKSKALQYLSLREHSRQELRRKLAQYAAKTAKNGASKATNRFACGFSDEFAHGFADEFSNEFSNESSNECSNESSNESSDDFAETSAAMAAKATDEIEAVLDWLESAKFLSHERFSESFVRRRQESYGTSRILAELQGHHLDPDLMAQTKSELAQTEEERAKAVWQKKFGNSTRSRNGTRAANHGADGIDDGTDDGTDDRADDGTDGRSDGRTDHGADHGANGAHGAGIRKMMAEERARQYRFLAQRGFTGRAIQAALRSCGTTAAGDDELNDEGDPCDC